MILCVMILNNHHLLSPYCQSGAVICAHIQHFTELSQPPNKLGLLLAPLCKPRTETEHSQDDTAGKWQNWILNQHLSGLQHLVQYFRTLLFKRHFCPFCCCCQERLNQGEEVFLLLPKLALSSWIGSCQEQVGLGQLPETIP